MSARLPRRRRALCALGLALLLAAAPTAEAAETLQDDLGRTLRFDTPPRRIVSLLPSLTESLWALGGGTRLVGVDRYSNWPAALDPLPRLGGLDDAQIEAIVALQPDVVVAASSARSLDRLESLGLRVLRLQTQTHADVRRTLTLLARLLGTPEAGERVWQDIDRAMTAAAARVPAGWRGRRAYFEVGGGPYAAGRASFIGETLARLGLDNVVPESLGPFPKLNPEFVVRAQPELVLGDATEQATMAARPGWATIPALRAGHRCAWPAAQYEVLIRPGPRLAEAAGLIADCLERMR